MLQRPWLAAGGGKDGVAEAQLQPGAGEEPPAWAPTVRRLASRALQSLELEQGAEPGPWQMLCELQRWWAEDTQLSPGASFISVSAHVHVIAVCMHTPSQLDYTEQEHLDTLHTCLHLEVGATL